MNETPKEETQEEKPFLKVIVHSFFIIPFLIAVFCVLLFASINLLTSEKRTAFDYLEDIKTGGLTKRWQGAFELSKILSNPKHVPDDPRFNQELITAFESSKHDDNRVRQYLALAMGRTQNSVYLDPLINSLDEAKEENIIAIVYALGMLKDQQAAEKIHEYVTHPNARLRSISVAALGEIGSPKSKKYIKEGLGDSEPNVQWGAAIALAHLGDGSGKNILLNLLNRQYYTNFKEVDYDEQTNLIIAAIDASRNLDDKILNEKILELSKKAENMKVRSQALESIQ